MSLSEPKTGMELEPRECDPSLFFLPNTFLQQTILLTTSLVLITQRGIKGDLTRHTLHLQDRHSLHTALLGSLLLLLPRHALQVRVEPRIGTTVFFRGDQRRAKRRAELHTQLRAQLRARLRTRLGEAQGQ